jgi:hypothetical protein
MRPTQVADFLFRNAQDFSATGPDDVAKVNAVLHQMVQGLAAMNTGLRATYMKLEEIEREIKRLKKS